MGRCGAVVGLGRGAAAGGGPFFHLSSTVVEEGKHWDDYEGDESGLAFFSTFLEVALRHCIERVPVYQWHAHKRQALVERAWEERGLLMHQQIIWAKARGTLGRSHFMWSHEPCFYGWMKGSMPESDRRPPANETTTWEIDQAGELSEDHPTQKPVGIFARPIDWHTRAGELVLEPFSGSGTQIIAAEETSRRCRAMEESPAYVDVAVVRWQRATGNLAVLEGTAQTFEEVAEERGAA
ncbi:MAG: DNA modification methylase [Candidatus Paceibacteria bacterium]|jgi:DNA modification methylase